MDHSNIPEEEERLLAQVKKHLEAQPPPRPRVGETQQNYEQQLLELRDEIAQARLEDVPALVAQMERLAGVAARRAEVQEVNGWVVDTLRAHGREAPVNARVVEVALEIEAGLRQPSPKARSLLTSALAANPAAV